MKGAATSGSRNVIIHETKPQEWLLLVVMHQTKQVWRTSSLGGAVKWWVKNELRMQLRMTSRVVRVTCNMLGHYEFRDSDLRFVGMFFCIMEGTVLSVHIALMWSKQWICLWCHWGNCYQYQVGIQRPEQCFLDVIKFLRVYYESTAPR